MCGAFIFLGRARRPLIPGRQLSNTIMVIRFYRNREVAAIHTFDVNFLLCGGFVYFSGMVAGLLRGS